MIHLKLLHQERAYSQLAGLLYLIIAIVGGFSIGYMPTEIVADGNASLTFQNLLTHQGLFRLGIAGDIIVLVLEMLLTVMLYQLFKSVSFTGMIIATYSRLAMTIIMGVNLINYLIPAIITSQPKYLNSFSSTELESLTLLFFQAHKYGELTWQVFFAIHLFTLAYVIRKSGKTPKWLGVLMLAGGLGYAGDSFIRLTLMDSEFLFVVCSSLLVLAVIAEFWFAFWLLSKHQRSIV